MNTGIYYANVWHGDIVWCHKVIELKVKLLTRCFRSSVWCGREELPLAWMKKHISSPLSLSYKRDSQNLFFFFMLSIVYESNLSTRLEMILRLSSSINPRTFFINEAPGVKVCLLQFTCHGKVQMVLLFNCSLTLKTPPDVDRLLQKKYCLLSQSDLWFHKNILQWNCNTQPCCLRPALCTKPAQISPFFIAWISPVGNKIGKNVA